MVGLLGWWSSERLGWVLAAVCAVVFFFFFFCGCGLRLWLVVVAVAVTVIRGDELEKLRL